MRNTRLYISSARVYNDLYVGGGDDEANVLHSGCVLGENMFELYMSVSVDHTPNVHTTIITTADDVRTQSILVQRTPHTRISGI